LASFVEQAVLQVLDQSSGPIRKINSELAKLFATAKSLRSVKIDIKVNAPGVSKAVADLTQLKTVAQGLRSTSINLRVNAQGISQATRQLQQLRAEAARPIPVATQTAAAARRPPAAAAAVPAAPARRPPGAVPAPLPAPGRGAGGVGGGIRGPISVVGTVAVSNIDALANAAIRAGGRAAKEGYLQTDIADTKAALQQYTPKQRTEIETALDDLQKGGRESPTGPYWNRAQQKNLMVEAMNTAGGDVQAAAFLVKQAESLAKVGQGMGQTADQARENALYFIKAGEQMGALRDAAGKFDVAKATQYFDTMRQAQIQVGSEFTGQKWWTTVSTAQTAKYGLDPRGMMTLALGMEESGSKFATGMNEFIKQASGARLEKYKLQNLEALGLVEPGTAAAKSGKGRAGMSLVDIIGKGAVDEGELRKNVHGWIQDRVKPAMEKLGLDITNVADIAKFAGKVTSGKGTDFLTNLIKRSQEWQQDIDRALSRRSDIATSEANLKDSGRIVGQGLKNEIQSTLGEAVNLAEPAFLYAAKNMSTGLSRFAESVSKGELPDIAAIGTAAAAAAAIPAVGMVSGMTAMMSEDPGIRSLGAAGTSLNAAGFSLNAAAGALAAAAGVKLPGADLPGGKPGAPESRKTPIPEPTKPTVPGEPTKPTMPSEPTKPTTWPSKILQNVVPFLAARASGIFGGIAAALAVLVTPTNNMKSNLPKLEKLNDALEEQARIAGRLTQADKEKADIERGLVTGKTTPADYKAAQEKLTALNAEIKALEERSKAARKTIEEQAKDLDKQVQEEAKRQNAAQIKQLADDAADKKKKDAADEVRMTELQRRADERRKKAIEEGIPQPDPNKVYPPPMPTEPKKPLISTVEPLPVKVVEQPPPTAAIVPPPAATPAEAITTALTTAPPWIGELSSAIQTKPGWVGDLEVSNQKRMEPPPPSAISEPAAAPTTSMVAELTAAAPGIGSAMGTGLSTALTSSIAAAVQPISDTGSNLASSLTTGAGEIRSAATEVAGSGEKAAGALQNAAGGIGAAIGSAAAAKIQGAVANVTISVQHSGSVGGNADKGHSTGD
jgi:hypothetical protein